MLLPFCCISSLHWIYFCLQMQWVWVCCYLVPCLLDSLCHFLSVVGQLLVLLQLHLFLSIVAWLCHKILCMHLHLWGILFYQIASGNLPSKSNLFGLKSAVLMFHICMLCWEWTYWDNLLFQGVLWGLFCFVCLFLFCFLEVVSPSLLWVLVDQVSHHCWI